MLESLGFIILISFLLGSLFEKINTPKIIAMILIGIIFGHFGFNLIDKSILNISKDLRQFALVVILTRAGLLLKFEDIKKAGRPAILLCFLPALFEIIAFTLIGGKILNITRLEAGIIGSIIAAVSPAIVVPRMLNLMDKGYGTDKNIPQMILAGASVDDIFVLVVFTSLIVLEGGGKISVLSFLNIPISILIGAVLGYMVGIVLSKLFKKVNIIDTKKLLIIISVSFLLLKFEEILGKYIAFSPLIAIMVMGMAINKKDIKVAENVEKKYKDLWIFAEILLFVLVGASVDINYILNTGLKGVGLILIALIIRMVGVYISLIGTNLNLKEKIFVLFSYSPKATVQAAIGGIPLALGFGFGDIALSMAVLSILITAPLGSILIDKNYKRLLSKSR